MKSELAALVRKLVRSCGVDIVRYNAIPPLPADFDMSTSATIRRVQPYTMTSPERLHALIQAIRYVQAASIDGAIVECGVWRGGSMMAAALTLAESGDFSRELYLFDTFDGMTEPTAQDVAIDGQTASSLLESHAKTATDSVWCYANVDQVKKGMASTGYRPEAIRYVAGKVEDTIPHMAPSSISVLRLDTDWYESTLHSLQHLFPLLAKGGVLIIDDYGHWQGARKAVDEYFAQTGKSILLNRIDYTGRMAVKVE
jgi:O-methyltransferase